MRSEAVRQAVLERDDHRCQICGDDANLHVHHVQPLGMGGSEVRDVPENMVALCGVCHGKVHDGHLTIARFDGNEFEVMDVERRRMPHERLWRYCQHDAKRGEEITARLSAYSMIDREVAADVYELRKVFKVVDPRARSFKEYLADRGIEPAWDRLAKLYEGSKSNGVPWEDHVTATDYRRLVKNSGKGERRQYLYAKIPLDVKLYRTSDEDELRDMMKIGERLVKVGKCVWGLRSDRGMVYGPDGEEVEVETVEGDHLTDLAGEVLA